MWRLTVSTLYTFGLEAKQQIDFRGRTGCTYTTYQSSTETCFAVPYGKDINWAMLQGRRSATAFSCLEEFLLGDSSQ